MDVTYTGLMQSAYTVARTELTTVEYNVFMFIIQRTKRFGKTSEGIPLRHFMEGVYDREQNAISAAACTNKVKLRNALQSLADKGLIAVSKARKTNVYALLIDNIVEFIEMAKSKLKVSRKEKLAKNTMWVTSDPDEGVTSDPIQVRESKVREELSDSPEDRITESMNKVKEKNQEALKKKAAKAGKALTASATRYSWLLAMAEHFPEAPAISKIAKEDWYKLRAGAMANPPEDSMADFTMWAVANWTALRGGELSWAQHMGVVPSMPVFASLYKHILLVRSQGEINRRLNENKRNLGGREETQERRKKEEAQREAAQLKDALAATQREKEHYQRIAQQKTKRRRTRKATPKLDVGLADEIGDWEDHNE